MTEEEINEARARLQAEVEQIKLNEAHGKVSPVSNPAERQAQRLAAEGIIDIGSVIKEVLPKMKEMEQKARAFRESIIERCLGLESAFCDEHPDTELLVDLDQTVGKSWQKDIFSVHYLPCGACRAENQAILERVKLKESGIPDRLLDATFDNFKIEADDRKIKEVGKFKRQVQKGTGIILALGPVGTGKSHLAVATIRRAGEGLFVTEHDLIGELRQTYSENSGQDAMVEKYRTAKILVLDELTKDVTGKDIPALLYRILDYRHDKDMLTIITSNESIEDCFVILGPKLRDRMRQNYVVCNMVWESHRKPSS